MTDLTPDELQRIKGCTHLLLWFGGRLERLTLEQRQDLKQLLEKWLAQTEEQPPADPHQRHL